MLKVLTAIKNGENALLESPTGTGKTLCLLTAAIAALKQERDKEDGKIWDRQNETEKSKIIYTSRTFSQLKQVLRELKKTVYKLDVVLVGSRDQLCVNEKINHQSGIALRCECRQARRNTECTHYTEFDKNRNPYPQNSYDIEDLHLMGRLLGTCPYYVQKKQAQSADLILMPYNYIIDEEIRERTKISYRNSIIIIDEAHNIAGCSEESTSFDINTNFLYSTIEELK